MSVSRGDIDQAVELFSGLGEITTRKMMGGLCLYHAGTIFAIIGPEGGLYLKGEGAMRARLEEMGCSRWTYTRKDGSVATMGYWSLPDAALDDPDRAVALAREALEYL